MTMGCPVSRHWAWNSSIRSSSARAAEIRLSAMYDSTSPIRSASSTIISWGSKIWASTGPSRSAVSAWISSIFRRVASRASRNRWISSSTWSTGMV